MEINKDYAVVEPSRNEVNQLEGITVLEFGAHWCGYCRAAQPLIAATFADLSSIRHIKIEDGKGRPLGRSFRITLWPTLVFLKDGREMARLVRPAAFEPISKALECCVESGDGIVSEK